MRYRALGNTGLNVSVIGFGASPLGNEFGGVEPAEAERAVHAAIDCGINFFDVAPYYGRTLAEERLGAALAGKRQQVALATKCGRYDVDFFDFSAVRVRSSLEESLRRLRTGYIDVLTAHDIEYGDREQIVHETIPAMRQLQREGKARNVGISSLQLKVLADVAVRGRVDSVLSYCRYNLLLRDLDRWLTPVLQEHGIGLINASPLAMRLLTAEGAPAWHPATESAKQAAARIVALCESRGVDPAAFALAFCLQHTFVSTTLVGISNARELERNLHALSFEIEPKFAIEIEQIAAPIKNEIWPSGKAENRD